MSPITTVPWCPRCGFESRSDEDGRCFSCGGEDVRFVEPPTAAVTAIEWTEPGGAHCRMAVYRDPGDYHATEATPEDMQRAGWCRAATPPAVAWCPQCGKGPRIDEDGCCATCGATVGMVPDWRKLEAKIGALEAEIKKLRKTRPCAFCGGLGCQYCNAVEEE